MKAGLVSHRSLFCFALAVGLLAAGLAAWAQREASPPEEPVISPELLANPHPAPRPMPASEEPPAGSLNDLIVRIIKNDMPHGGTYATSASAFAGLRAAAVVENGALLIQPDRAEPSFCSGATYLVFLTVIERLRQQGRLSLDPDTLEKLLVRSQPDGTGIWGRWNANGPGTARLFYGLGLGPNFTSYDDAKPGDFMKIFWNDGIGSTERGHSAIFLSLEHDPDGGDYVNYWSSNQAGGFGYARKEKAKLRRVLFSRLEHPEALSTLPTLPPRDDYLAAMLKRPSTPAEMYRMTGVTAPVEATEEEESRPTPRRSAGLTAISTGNDPPAAPKSPAPSNNDSRTRSSSASAAKRSPAAAVAASPTPEKKKGLFERFFSH